MNTLTTIARFTTALLSSFILVGCASTGHNAGFHGQQQYAGYIGYSPSTNYGARLPNQLDTGGHRAILVDPNRYAWGAYNESGELVKSGIATSGGDFCEDTGRSCRTDSGRYRITSLGGPECISKTFPLPDGGGLMPYCMFFNNGQALHGSPEGAVVEANISHGCVRMRIPDAEWLRNNFAQVGTQVIIQPYN